MALAYFLPWRGAAAPPLEVWGSLQVMGSAGCAARGLAVAVGLLLSTLAAPPLVVFNEGWVGAVNRIVAHIVAATQV